MSGIREINTDQRHPAIKEICSYFRYDHLSNEVMANVSRIFFEAAERLLSELDDGPMLTHALHSLWEAKNYAVAQSVSDLRAEGVIR